MAESGPGKLDDAQRTRGDRGAVRGRGEPLSRPRVAVIGGGAAGTISAVHLLREAGPEGVLVDLIDRDGDFGPGVPYRTSDPLHVLNVPATRMGAISGEPDHFHRWLIERGEDAGPESFATRSSFGEYLRDLLDRGEREHSPQSVLNRVTGDAVAIEERADGSLAVQLAGGESLAADHVVLALGHVPGRDPVAPPPGLIESGIHVTDPWVPGALDAARKDDEVLIVGTGLTMVDVTVSLGGSGEGAAGPKIRAISRHGLVPRRHGDRMTRPESFPLPDPAEGLDALLAATFERIEEVGAAGGDWRDVLDSLRTPTPAYWRRLGIEDKRRFVTSINRFWDVHRFRIAPAVADRLEALDAAGRLRVDAGSILRIEAEGGRARVTTVEASGDTEEFTVDRVINCTGAGADITAEPPPVVAALFASGLARPDELSIGLDVGPAGNLIGADGTESATIHVVGGLRKGVEWEAIGVTEIRDHAAAAARQSTGVDREISNSAHI